MIELVTLTIQGREYSVQTESYVHQGVSRGKSTAKKIGGGGQVVPKDHLAVKPRGMVGHEIEQRIFPEQEKSR